MKNEELPEINDDVLMQHANEWLNDHGQPSDAYLKRLADENTVEAKDQLFEIADQYNIVYDSATPMQELIEKIRLYMDMGTGPA